MEREYAYGDSAPKLTELTKLTEFHSDRRMLRGAEQNIATKLREKERPWSHALARGEVLAAVGGPSPEKGGAKGEKYD